MASPDSQNFHSHYASELDETDYQFNGRRIVGAGIIFSGLIFFSLLFIYAKWVCRRRRRRLSPSASVMNILLPTRSLGLDPATIDSLSVFVHRSSSTTTDEAECSICLSIFQDEEKVKVLPECRHAYHSECVDMWLTTQSSCPLCRASLRSDSSNDSALP